MDAEAPRLQAGEGLRCQQVKQSVVGAISMNGWSWPLAVSKQSLAQRLFTRVPSVSRPVVTTRA